VGQSSGGDLPIEGANLGAASFFRGRQFLFPLVPIKSIALELKASFATAASGMLNCELPLRRRFPAAELRKYRTKSRSVGGSLALPDRNAAGEKAVNAPAVAATKWRRW
jgi:hypothetical protein